MGCTINSVKASNGKNSILFDKLSEEVGQNQAMKTWVATQTPTFEKEFGKTKVVDANGEPLVLYRGDRKGIEKYKYKDGGNAAKLGGGIYFTSDKAYAEKYGDVTPVFINSENIRVYKNVAQFMADVSKRFGIKTPPTAEQRRQFTAELHSQGIDVALEGFKELTIHSDTQYKVAIDIKSEKDIMSPIREKASADRKLDLEKRLISFLAPFGVTVEAMESLKERTGIDAAGVADIANRVILIAQGKATIDTLPEEAGHFIYELLGENNPLIQRMRQLAVKTQEFKNVSEKYGEVYKNNQNKLIKETVGKLIGKSLLNEFETSDTNKSLMNTIRRIWDRVKQLFKSADTRTLYREVESVYGSLASQILQGNTEGLAVENISDEGMLFDLGEDEQSEAESEAEKEVESTLTEAEKLIAEAQNAIEKKIDQINRTTSEDDKKASNIKKNLEYLQSLLNSEDKKTAIITFLAKAQKDMLAVRTKLKHFAETGQGTAAELLRYAEYVEAYKPAYIRALLNEVEETDEFDELIPSEKRQVFKDSFFSLHAQIQDYHSQIGKSLLAKKLQSLNANTEMDEKDISDLLEIGQKDVRSWQRWMEVLAESPDTIIALGTKMINQEKELGRLETREFEIELNKKIDEFEEFRASQGVKIGNPKALYEIFYEKKDGKTTGRLLKHSEAVALFGKDSKEMEFYTYFTQKYFELQKKLPVQYRKGLWMPSIRQSSKEKIAMGMGPVKAAKEELAETFTIQADDAGFGNLERSSNKYVPILYHAPIGTKEGELNPDVISYDLGNSLSMFGSMAINNQHMNKIVSDLEILKEILAERDVIKTSGGRKILDRVKKFGTEDQKAQTVKGIETNAYKQFVQYIDMVVYGEVKDSDTVQIFGKQISKVKLADALNKYSSMRTLAFNLFSGISNLTMGKLMNFIEAHAGEFFAKKDYRKAEADYLGSVAGFMSDLNKKSPESIGGQLVELFDALQEYDEYGNPVKGNRLWKRLIKTDAAFFLQKGGEHSIQVTLMYAFLRGQKIKDKAGNEISLLDAFEQKDGELVVKDSVSLSPEDIAKYSQKLKQISQKLHGVYNSQDLINAQKIWAGRMAILFRKWLYPSYKRRYGDKRFNQRLETWEEGNYRTTYTFLKDVFKTMKATELGLIGSYKKTKSELEDYQRRNMRRTKAELLSSMSIILLISAIAGLDDEDEERTWAENMVLFQLHRLNSEIAMYVNPIEAMKILKSPSASMSTVETVIRLTYGLLDAGASFITEGDIPRYKRDTGLYDAGDAKVLKPLEELIPLWKEARAATAPENRLKYMLWK